MNISVNFTEKERDVSDQLFEISQGQPISRFVKSILTDYVNKYNSNPVLKERQTEASKLDGIMLVLNDSQFMNRAIQNMDENELRIFESTLFALNIKVSKKFKYGTVNAR